jgi:hypothetical protein
MQWWVEKLPVRQVVLFGFSVTAVASVLARPLDLTQYAWIYGSALWADYYCAELRVDKFEVREKLQNEGMKSEEFFSKEMQQSIKAVMTTLQKEEDRRELCEFILEQYGPNGRVMPGLVKKTR